LKALVAHKLEELDDLLPLKQQAAPRTRVHAQLQDSKRVMDPIRQIVAAIQASARQAIAVIVLANVASFSLLITGFVVLRRENARRAQAEYELPDVNQSRLGGSGIGKLDQHHTARPEGGLEQSGQGCGQLA
jgi:hypothetical protein